MVGITEKPIFPEIVVGKVKTDGSGCVVTYVGVIRGYSRGKSVLSVEYEDVEGRAEARLREIAREMKQKWQLENVAIMKQKWQLENVAISHRTGKLKVGDINLVVAVASAHRKEGFAACQYAIDQFKQKLPTHKKETYQDGSVWVEE